MSRIVLIAAVFAVFMTQATPAPSPFRVSVTAEPQLPVTNYVQNGGFERGLETYVFSPEGRKSLIVTNDAYEGKCALWTAKGKAGNISGRADVPPGLTNRLAITVKLGPEHKGHSGLGAGIWRGSYAGPKTAGKVFLPMINVERQWQQADSYPGWQRIESEPFVVPADATNVNIYAHAGSMMYCQAGGVVDNLFCGPAWTELSFKVENAAGLAQVTVEDENGDRVFCAEAFPEDLTSFERTIRVSAAMRYCVKAVDREARSVAKWYPSPRPEVAAERAPLTVKGLRRLWPSSEKAAVFTAEMRGAQDLSGASLEMIVTATNGQEVLRKTVSPVLVQTRLEVPLARLADGCYQLCVTYRDKSGATIAAESPVDFWRFPAAAKHPRDVYTIKNRTLYKNGKFFFPIFSVSGFPGWDVLRNHRFDKAAYLKWARDVIADEKACGFNVMQSSPWFFPDLARRAAAEPACQKYFPSWMPYSQAAQLSLDFLDVARLYDEQGMAVIPYLHIPRPDRSEDVSAWLKTIVSYRKADNLLCWCLSDELDAAIVHNRMLNDLHHEADPARLTWINFINGADKNHDSGDILSEDPYPVPKQALSKVVWHAEKLRRCTRPDQGIFLWLQMFGGEGSWTRSPTLAELEAMVYMSLNHGVRGLAYFGYSYALTDRDGIRSMTEADYAGLGEMNRRVLSRAPIFCLGEELYCKYDDVLKFDCAVFRYDGAIWVSVVNGLNEARRIDVSLPVEISGTGKMAVAGDFAPYGVRLYQLKDSK